MPTDATLQTTEPALERRITFRFGTSTSAEAKVIPLHKMKSALQTQHAHSVSASKAEKAASPIQNHYQTDIGALEQLIRATNEIASVAKQKQRTSPTQESETKTIPTPIARETNVPAVKQLEPMQQPPAASLARPNTDGTPKYSVGMSLKKLARPSALRPSILAIVVTVAAALITGVLFGLLVLRIFAFEQGVSAERNAATLTQAPTGTEQPEVIPNAMANSEYYLLQYGVFSQFSSIEKATETLNEAGLASAEMPLDGNTVIYSGIATNPAQLDQLLPLLEGQEVIQKVLLLPRLENTDLFTRSPALSTFIADTDELIRQLTTYTISNLRAESVQRTTWQPDYEAWTASIADAHKSLLDDEATASFTSLTEAMQKAATSLQAYDATHEAIDLWNAQSALMTAVLAEKTWLERELAVDN
jgi:hypothetical protein